MQSALPLRCPFCNAEEDERVEAVDHDGNRLVLVMFDCPFSYRFAHSEIAPDEELQRHLNDWRIKEGSSWLDSLGPVIRKREMRGIERYEKSLKNN